ncbi:hypothetical protein V8Q34_14810 [Blautia sp. JLR.GB0024]|uniref:hypothetical protein n=1 Tax=Blautia sp. JLR.GB0024 TaxID=3123295 RepID=UPI003003C5BB
MMNVMIVFWSVKIKVRDTVDYVFQKCAWWNRKYLTAHNGAGKERGKLNMVHLIKNYYAVPNNMGFTLVIDKGRKNQDGTKSYDTIGYCGSFEEAIFLLRRKIVDRKLKSGLYELSEALNIIRETSEEIKTAIDGKVGEENSDGSR